MCPEPKSKRLMVKSLVVFTPLNSSGMYRGVIRRDGKPRTAIFDDECLE